MMMTKGPSAAYLGVLASAITMAVGAGAARAQDCGQVTTATNCWNDYSGTNFGQVASATLPPANNQGLVCAVTAGDSNTNWGGGVWCYRPDGATGAAVVVE